MEKCGEQSKSTSNHRVEKQSVHICKKKKYAVGASLLFIKYMFMYMFILLRWGFSQAGLKHRVLIASASECWD